MTQGYLESPKVLAIIPARGGSKGVPKKNIKTLGNKPLIHYSIEAANQSHCVTDFVVSTDCEEILAISQQAGAKVIRRPNKLATDHAPVVAAVDHVLDILESARSKYDIITLLQPTSPFRTAIDIDNALTALINSDADTIISVYKVDDAHPSRMYTESEGQLIPYNRGNNAALRQQLPDVFHRNGAIYATRRNAFKAHQSLMSGKIIPYQMPLEQSVNIDNPLDFLLAEVLLERNASQQKINPHPASLEAGTG